MILFNGQALAQDIEKRLGAEVASLSKKVGEITIAAIHFREDDGSALYTRLKAEAADRVGIRYQVAEYSMRDEVSKIVEKIKSLNMQSSITGIIIQKPSKSKWLDAHQQIVGPSSTKSNSEKGQGSQIFMTPLKSEFDVWWKTLTASIDILKDVDGLHPQTLASIKKNTWKEEGRVLPATAKAVLKILSTARDTLKDTPDALSVNALHVVLGTSDILGKPLAYELQNQQNSVELFGSNGLQRRIDSGIYLRDARVIISATGHRHLITGSMIAQGAIVIDVGEPYPDVEFNSVAPKSSFITPVPGGVGPLTVVSLLENSIFLAKRRAQSGI